MLYLKQYAQISFQHVLIHIIKIFYSLFVIKS